MNHFGIASLRATVGPRRLPDFGPHTSPDAWACQWLLSEPTDDDALMIAVGVLYVGAGLSREPGELGLDDCKSEGRRLLGLVVDDDDRVFTVDDLVGFGSDE